MGGSVNKTPAALRDLEAITDYLLQESPDAAHRFLFAAEKAFHLLASQPLLGEVYPHPVFSDLRFWTLGRRFRNYVVFYRPLVDGAEIIRVLHGARDLPNALGAAEPNGE